MRQEINNDIARAFDTDLADAVSNFVGVRKLLTDEDWLENGNATTSYEYKGRGVFSGFSASEIDGNTILSIDVKLICLQSEVTDIPLVDDLINGYQVIAVRKDPANVSFTIQLRQV